MIKLQGYFQGFNSKVDGSASLRFTTNELDAESFAELKRNLNNFGWIVFAENEVPEVPKEEAVEDSDKKPSRRQRAVIYRIWEQKGKEGDFETYYRAKMEKIIEVLKGQLE